MNDSIRVGLAFGIAFLAGIAGLSGSLVLIKMTDQVNAKLPPERQLGMRGWGRVNGVLLVREYRRLYSDGPPFRGWVVLTGALFAVGATAATILFCFPLALVVDLGAVVLFGVCCRLAFGKEWGI